MPQRLGRLDVIAEGGSARLAFAGDSFGHGLCVLRRGNRLHAYLNRCPHTGGPMDWQPGVFLDADGTYIQCSTHGALFRVEDGYCVSGPCAGASLTAMAVTVRDGELLLEHPAPVQAI